jgi:hypothetical protein
MAETEEQVQELIYQSMSAPKGPTAISFAEEAVRIADTLRDVHLGMEAREQLIDAAGNGGRSDKMLVAFTWCLARCDRAPDEFEEEDFFWSFKWVGEHLAEFPHISRTQVFALFDDMERRYKRHDYSIKPVHKLRCNACVEMGDMEQARKWFAKWQKERGDWNNDCAACEANSKGEFQLALGDFAAARRTYKPIIETLKLKCAEVPHLSHGRMLLPLHEHDLQEEAERSHKLGYKLVRNNPDFLVPVGQHIAYAAARGDVKDGLKMLEKHAGWLTHSGSPLDHFEFFVGIRAVLAAGKSAASTDQVKLRLPKELPVYRPDGEYPWDDLLAWADSRLNELATAFDKRNGNDYYSSRVREARDG